MDEPSFFGRWVRRRRRALDLTQQQLATQVGCAVITLQKIEAEERRPSREMAERLADALAIPAAEHVAFIRAARTLGEPPPLEPPDAVAHPTRVALPPHTPLPVRHATLPATLGALIGRERETDELLALLRRPGVRLVTLTGPGGVGKTRLALEVAGALVDHLPDGACFVALATLNDPALVAGAIARVLNVRESAGQPLLVSLQAHLREWRGLLLLDNFEQVVAAASLVAELLAAAPGLVVLATSRRPLHLSGEYEYAVPPLAQPDPADSSPEHVLAAAAVRLFHERARAARADFTLTHTETAAVAEICRRLDGLPLAIEMVAARVKLFPPAALLARLDQRLKLLTSGARDLPSRQQTMRATIDWSYTLLDPAEQTLFARLAVFIGGCSLEAAEAVGDVDGDLPFAIIDGVAALLDHSLLRRADGVNDEPRFTMLETIREYALEQLVARGELAAMRRRHAEHYLALAEAAEQKFRTAAWPAWQARLEWEYDNVRAAVGWAVEQGGDPLLGLRLAGALLPFWQSSGRWFDGHRLTLAALAACDREGPEQLLPVIRARALLAAGMLTDRLSDLHTARQLLEQSTALFRAAGDIRGLADAQIALGSVIIDSTITAREPLALAETRMLIQEGITVLRGVDDRWGVAEALYELALLAVVEDHFAEASAYVAEGLAICRALGHNEGIARGLWTQISYALNSCELAQAQGYSAELLAHTRQFGLQLWVVIALEQLGWVALLHGNVADVVQHFSESKAIAERLGDRWHQFWGHHHLGWAAWATGDLALAEARHRENLAMARTFEAKGGVAWSLNGLGLVALSQGDAARSEALLAESLAIFREGYIPFDTALALNCLGRAVLAGGNAARAAGLFAESIVVARPRNNRWTIALALEGLAEVAVVEGRFEAAAQLFGAVDALREQMGVALWPPFREEQNQRIAALRAAIGKPAFTAAWQAGRVLPLEAAIGATEH